MCLSILKPLAIKLQNRDIDVYEAYQRIEDVKSDIQEMRNNIDTQFHEWFNTASQLARKFGVEPRMPRTLRRQQHRSNVEADDLVEYYRRNLAIPFLDHLSAKMDNYFNYESNKVLSSFLCLIPKLLVSKPDSSIEEAFKFYQE